MAAAAVYVLCTSTALACCVLLFRGYARSRSPLLLSSGICFFFLTLENLGLFLDRVVIKNFDISLFFAPMGLIGISILLYGMVMETK